MYIITDSTLFKFYSNIKRMIEDNGKCDTVLGTHCDDFDGRNVSANEITLYYTFSYHQSHRLHTEHTLIYATRIKGKKRYG